MRGNQEAEIRGRGGAGGGPAGAKPGSVLWRSIPGPGVGVAGAGSPAPTGHFSSHNPGSGLSTSQSEAEINKTELNRVLLGSFSSEAHYLS